MRNVLAVILGVAAAGFVMMGVETVGHSLYPAPPGLSPDDPRAIEQYVANAPFLAIAFVLIAWASAAFVGGAVAARLAVGRRTQRFGFIVGLILFVGGVAQMWMIPHPTWFVLAAPFAFLIPGMAGGRAGCQRY